MKTYIAVISDTHCGHKLGLCAPGVTLYDESKEGQLVPYTPALTAFQSWIYDDVFEPAVSKMRKKTKGKKTILVHLGDPTHGDGHAEQLMSTRQSDQLMIAKGILDELCEALEPKAIRLVMGTGVHELGEGSSSILLSEYLKSENKGIDAAPVYHDLLEIDGRTFDLSHHGPAGGLRVWLGGNNARYYLKDIMLQALVNGEDPPDMVMRGHVHVYIDEIVTTGKYKSRMIVMPSMCGLSDYARKVTRSTGRLTVGMMLIEISGGQITDVVPYLKTLDIRTKEKL